MVHGEALPLREREKLICPLVSKKMLLFSNFYFKSIFTVEYLKYLSDLGTHHSRQTAQRILKCTPK